MGFYGNATYYLPNGIAQNVVDGVITTKKLAKDAVTASKIAETAIHGLSTGNNLEKDKNGNPIDKLDEDGENVIRPSHFAKQTITGEGHNKKKRIVNSQGEIVDSTTEKWPGDIALETITGGDSETKGNIAPNTIQQYNMADNSVGTDQIIKSSITREKLDHTYWCGNEGKKLHIISGLNELLDALPYDLAFDGIPSMALIYIDNVNSENWGIEPVFSIGYYIGFRNYGKINLISYRGNQGANYEFAFNGNKITSQIQHKIIQNNMANDSIGTDQIIDDSINSYKITDYQIHGSGDNSEFEHIAEKSIGTNDIADKAIKRNQINDWAVQKEHIAGHAIQGLASDDVFILTDGTKKSHIAPKSIAGGENGDIALNTITGGHKPGMGNIAEKTIYGYNIFDGSITADKLSDNYLKIKESAMSYSTLEELKIDLDTMLDQILYFRITSYNLNLPFGVYLALPQINIPNISIYRIVFNMETGVSYILKELSNNTVIAYSINASASEWKTQTAFDSQYQPTNTTSIYSLGLKDYVNFEIPEGIYAKEQEHNDVIFTLNENTVFSDRCKIILPYESTLSIQNKTGYNILFLLNNSAPKIIYNDHYLWNKTDKLITDTPICLEIERLSNSSNPGKYLICRATAILV